MKFLNRNDANDIIIKLCYVKFRSILCDIFGCHDFEISDTRPIKAAGLIHQAQDMFSTFTEYQNRYIKLHTQVYHYDLKPTVVI